MARATLSELLTLPGAVAAFEFTGGGLLLDHRLVETSPLDATTLDLMARMCAANLSIAGMQALGWETVTGMTGFDPVRTFSLIGFDWSVSVVRPGNERCNDPFRGVVVANGKADYQGMCEALERA